MARALRSLCTSGLLSAHECAALALVCRSWRAVVDAVVHGRRSALLTSAACARHRVPGRVERPERLQAIVRRCAASFPRLRVERALPAATDAQLTRVHSAVYVDMVTRMSSKVERSMASLDAVRKERLLHGDGTTATGGGKGRPRANSKSKEAYYLQFEYVELGQDTSLMRHTLSAARAAAGGVCLAVDRVLRPEHEEQNAFCVVRPPGHHAEPQRALGFCVFNNVAIGALHALEAHALERVAIIDVDVHHGNGTQAVVDSEPRLLYVSLHQAAPCFPNSGHANETGEHGNLLNVPLRARSTAHTYRETFRATVAARVKQFAPQLVMVSMGFDASSRDPLADQRLEASDYYWVTRELCKLAWHCCDGKLVSVLEGGYHLGALADGAEAHMKALIHGSYRPDGPTEGELELE